jgi:hypothetical protein
VNYAITPDAIELFNGLLYAGETPHDRPHTEIAALGMAGRNVVGIGVAFDRRLLCADAFGRALPLLGVGCLAVNLDCREDSGIRLYTGHTTSSSDR